MPLRAAVFETAASAASAISATDRPYHRPTAPSPAVETASETHRCPDDRFQLWSPHVAGTACKQSLLLQGAVDEPAHVLFRVAEGRNPFRAAGVLHNLGQRGRQHLTAVRLGDPGQ